VLKQILLQLVAMLRKETKRREEVERDMHLLLRKLTAPRSLPASEGQPMLFDMNGLLDEQVPAPPIPEAKTAEAPAPRRHAHGRRKPPANLEQVDIIHDLPDELKQDLGPENLIPLPDVITFQYDYQAAVVRLLRHVQKKYVHRSPGDAAESGEPNAEPASEESTPEEGLSRTIEPQAAATTAGGPVASTTTVPTEAIADGTNGAVDGGSPAIDRARPMIVIAPKPWAMPSCEAAPGLLAYVWRNMS